MCTIAQDIESDWTCGPAIPLIFATGWRGHPRPEHWVRNLHILRVLLIPCPEASHGATATPVQEVPGDRLNEYSFSFIPGPRRRSPSSVLNSR